MSVFEIASAAHLAGSVVLALFFALLARHDERPYLRIFVGAWVSQAAALLVPFVTPLGTTRSGLALDLFLLTTHAVLVGAAAQSFARGVILRGSHAWVLVAVAIWSAAAPPAFGDVGLVHAAQLAILALAYLTAAALLWPLREPGGLGLRLAVNALGLVGALEAVQAAVLARAVTAGAGRALYLEMAPFAVLFVQMLVGLGMALAVAEGAQFALLARDTQLKDAERRVKVLSDTDRLTGCASREVFRDLVDDVRARPGQRGVLLVIDVDRLRAVNEREGQEAGDDVLRRLADAIRARTRTGDIAVRWGGDEFLVVIPGATRAEAESRIAELEVEISLAGVSASAGLAAYGGGTDVMQAVEEAEAALRAAKRARGGQARG